MTDIDVSTSLWEKIERLRACLHGMDDEFVAAVEDQHNGFQEASSRVEPEAQLPSRVTVGEVVDPQ